MFGQYSSQFVGRKTKRDMVAGAARRHPDSTFRNFAFLAFRFSGLTEQGAHLWLHDIDRNGGKLDARALGKVRRFARRHMSLA